MASIFYVFQGKSAVRSNDATYDLRIPIDITRRNIPLEQGTKLVAEASEIEELKMFFCDYYWAMHQSHFLRHTESLDNHIKSELEGILSKKQERRTPNPTSSGRFKRRIRKYKCFLPPPHFAR